MKMTTEEMQKKIAHHISAVTAYETVQWKECHCGEDSDEKYIHHILDAVEVEDSITDNRIYIECWTDSLGIFSFTSHRGYTLEMIIEGKEYTKGQFLTRATVAVDRILRKR